MVIRLVGETSDAKRAHQRAQVGELPHTRQKLIAHISLYRALPFKTGDYLIDKFSDRAPHAYTGSTG